MSTLGLQRLVSTAKANKARKSREAKERRRRLARLQAMSPAERIKFLKVPADRDITIQEVMTNDALGIEFDLLLARLRASPAGRKVYQLQDQLHQLTVELRRRKAQSKARRGAGPSPRPAPIRLGPVARAAVAAAARDAQVERTADRLLAAGGIAPRRPAAAAGAGTEGSHSASQRPAGRHPPVRGQPSKYEQVAAEVERLARRLAALAAEEAGADERTRP